jgi:hypothetical protein
MTKQQIIAAIRVMRDRETLSEIINAAEARDCHLSNLESEDRRKRAWSKLSHLKKGDTVFIHKDPAANLACTPGGKLPASVRIYGPLWGKALTVAQVKPRAKEIVISYWDREGGGKVKLTALVATDLKLSETPTASAFDHTLTGGMKRSTA